MRYELTKDLETGNVLIDNEHRELLHMVNDLQEACAAGKGREFITPAANYLLQYVNKHFADEDALQREANYPGYEEHYKFHEDYKGKMEELVEQLLSTDANIASLAMLNQAIGKLISHIKIADRQLATYLRSVNS